ncbi:MAG: Caspase domain protein [Smithella sp. PtaU1.Bin162]|nr:MAG: Caspase domain protein [Smithella sp. PtaU1.Bin162]
MKKIFILFLLFFYSTIAVQAAPAPEIFVQTGHSSPVKFVAMNPGGSHLVTTEDGQISRFMKIWDIASSREIKTVKLETEHGMANNIHFISDDKFIVIYRKSAEIYDLHGQKIQTLPLPKSMLFGMMTIDKDKRYLFDKTFMGTKIYGMKDGAEIFLPELQRFKSYEIYHQAVADLGYGYYGVFHKGQTSRGNVDYVIYDENLDVRKKGSLKIPDVAYGSAFQISPDLQYLAYQAGNRKDKILVFNLATVELTISYQTRALAKPEKEGLAGETLYFGFLPDGRLRIEYDRQKSNRTISARSEMVLVSSIKNGIYTEKKLILDDVTGQIAFQYQVSPYLFTDKSTLFAGFAGGDVKMIDSNTGAEIKSFGVKPVVFSFSHNVGDLLLNYQDEYSFSDKIITQRFNLWDLGGAGLKKVNVTASTGLYSQPERITAQYTGTAWYSTDPEKLYSSIPREFLKDNYKQHEKYGRIQGIIFLTKDELRFHTDALQHKLVLKDKKTGKLLADLYAFADGEWIIMTPEGYYSASANGDKYLSVRINNNVYGIENYREAFFRPDLVKIAIKGNALEGYKNLAQVGNPPSVRIENMPDKVATDSVKINVGITDQGGGVGEIRLFLNDTSVMTDNTRAVSIKAVAGRNELVRSYTLKLLPGENVIKAIAFDKENNVQSNPAVHKITAVYKEKRKPALYALVIGINEYKNPKLTLKYAVADANLFSSTLRETAGGLFDKVEITSLILREKSTKSNILKELNKYKELDPADVFAFYVASHGTVDEGEYFLITSNVGALSTDKLKTDAVTQKELREAIANIPAAKKLIVIDTCNAGKLGEQLQMAMLTRGMSEDTAMKILSRAVGSTIISASSSLQEALEGYKNHGLFTYVLTEGMRGKADPGRTGYIKTSALAAYVEETVPELAENVFKKAQYPTKAVNGNDFPIGRIK